MKKAHDKKLLKIWADKVKENADYKCEFCGNTQTLNSHHYFGKKSRSTRYWIENGFCLCYSHHKGAIQSAHESPEWFRSEAIKWRGNIWLKELKDRWSKISKPEYEKVIKYLNGETKEY